MCSVFKKEDENKFLERRNAHMCENCGFIVSRDISKCPKCDNIIGVTGKKSEDIGMKFLNLNESLKRRTKYWRELMLIFAAIKLPIEVIAFFELDSFIGKMQGIGDLIFALVLLIVSAWLVFLKRVRIRNGETVDF